MVATNSTEIYFRLKEIKDQGRRDGGTGGDDQHPVLGFNFKYTNVQAAIGLAQMERLGNRLAHFAERDAWYREMLADCPGLVFLNSRIGRGKRCNGRTCYAATVNA